MKNDESFKALISNAKSSIGESFTVDEEIALKEYHADESARSSLAIKVLSILGGFLAAQAFMGFLFSAGLYNSSIGLLLVSGFILLFQKPGFHNALHVFSPLGRMSMSNYIIQSILGSLIYYGYGLGMYQFAGSTYAVLTGIGLITLQILFSRWWMKNHKQGPLESIWHKLTWVTMK